MKNEELLKDCLRFLTEAVLEGRSNMPSQYDLNFDRALEKYAHEPRTVVPHGRVYVPSLAVIKFYSMMKGESPPRECVEGASSLIGREITSGKINTYSGHVFAILSED